MDGSVAFNPNSWLGLGRNPSFSAKQELEAFFPISVFSDLTVVSADFNLLINGKHFLRRIASFTDNRLDGTYLEGVNITEFHYATYHKGKKYEFYLCYFGSDKAVGSLSAYFNTIAGTIKFS